MSQGEIFHTEEIYGTPEVAAATACINFTGGVFFHGKETFVTPMVAALAAAMRVADLTENCEIYPTCIQLPCRVAGGPRRKFAKVFSSWKTRMIWLPHAEERIVIYLVVSMQY